MREPSSFIIDACKRIPHLLNWEQLTRVYNIPLKIIDANNFFLTEDSWYNISANYNLTEDFIRKFKDRVRWALLSGSQNLSEDFIIEFEDRICFFMLQMNDNISKEIKIKFKDRIPK